MVIASEKRNVKPGSLQEMQYGAAAGALLVGEGTDLIASFLGAESISVPFIDHFRKAGERVDYYWEERWIRDEGISKTVPGAVKMLLDRIGRKPADVHWFGLNGGPLGSDKLVAKALGISPDGVVPDLQGQVGDAGAAHGVLSLIGAIESAKAGDLLVMASFAQGCDVIAFKLHRPVTATPARGLAGTIARRIPESAYLKMLSFTYPMAEEPANVATYTADWLQYSPAPPLYMGLVQFDVGARVLMEIVDVGTSGIEVGNSLSMVFRIKERDKLRQYDRYFWKATPRI